MSAVSMPPNSGSPISSRASLDSTHFAGSGPRYKWSRSFTKLANTLRHSLSSRSLGSKFRSEDPYKLPNDSGPTDSAYGSGRSVSEPDNEVFSRNSDVSSLSTTSLGTLSNSSIVSLKHPMPQRVYRDPTRVMDNTNVSRSVEDDDLYRAEATAFDMPFGVMPFGAGRSGAEITPSGSPHTPSTVATPPGLDEAPDDPSVLIQDSDDSSTISADSHNGDTVGRAYLEPIQESSDEHNHSAPLGPVLNRGPDYSQTSFGSSRVNSLHRTHSVHGRPGSRPSSVRSDSGRISRSFNPTASAIDQEIDPTDLSRFVKGYWDNPYADTTVNPREAFERDLSQRLERELAAQKPSGQIPNSGSLPAEFPLDVHNSTSHQATSTSSRSSARSRFVSFFSGISKPSFVHRSASDKGSRLFRRDSYSRPFQLPGKGRFDAWKNNYFGSRSSTKLQKQPRTYADIEKEMYGQIPQDEARRKYQAYVYSSHPDFTHASGSSRVSEWISRLPENDSAVHAEEYRLQLPEQTPTTEEDWFSHIKLEAPKTLEDALRDIREDKRKANRELAEDQSPENLYVRYWGKPDQTEKQQETEDHWEETHEAVKQQETEDEREIRALTSQIFTLQERLSELESRVYKF